MKKKLGFLGLCVGVVLLMGAVAVESVEELYIQPHTISSWGELVDCYLAARTSLPPLPFAYEDALTRMSAEDWSFLAAPWSYTQADGAYYVSKKSKLAKLKLPLHILVYEDVRRGDIIILSSPDGTNFKGEALFDAPEFMPYESDFPADRYAADELWPRRIVWAITLKPEADALSDLVSKESALTVATLSVDDGMRALMSVPAEHADELWLCLEPQTNGIDLKVFAPEGFTNRVEIYSCADLVSNIWNIAAQNFHPSGTNPAVWAVGGFDVHFYAAGNMDIDSDGDGLPDARETFFHKTDPNDADTDRDRAPDGWELQSGFNPLFYADGGFDLDSDGLNNSGEYLCGTDPDNPDSEDDGMPDGWEIAGGLNPLADDTVGDPDDDGIDNLAEYIAGTHPQVANVVPPTGATGSLIFRYDDDGRLTEAHLNNVSAEIDSLTPAHNVTGVEIFVH
jgi:hypothetical protein